MCDLYVVEVNENYVSHLNDITSINFSSFYDLLDVEKFSKTFD